MDNRPIFQPHGKVIGGLSSLNGIVFVRGHTQDFDGWAAEGVTGWGYDDVLPHFRSMETYGPGADDFRGGSGPISVDRLTDHHPLERVFLDVVAEAGLGSAIDYNGAELYGGTAFDFNIALGERCATAALIRRTRHRGNLTILTGAHVTALTIVGGRATSVSFLQGGRLREASCDSEVIL